MNNKKKGNSFEKSTIEYLSNQGYWAHFIVPDKRGAQPFDIIAVKDGMAYAIDCKTCVDKYFRITRLEDNQISAFTKWLKCGNTCPIIYVEHNGRVYEIYFKILLKRKSINLEELKPLDDFTIECNRW